jgi:hypothetical protein
LLCVFVLSSGSEAVLGRSEDAAAATVRPGGLAAMNMWNWWQSLVMTPEPTTFAVLAAGGPLLLLRRRRRT